MNYSFNSTVGEWRLSSPECSLLRSSFPILHPSGGIVVKCGNTKYLFSKLYKLSTVFTRPKIRNGTALSSACPRTSATCSTQLCSAAVGTSGTGAMRSVIGNVPIFTPSRTLQSRWSKGGQIHKVGSGPPDQYCRIANLRLKTWIGKGSSNPPHCTLLCKPQLFT